MSDYLESAGLLPYLEALGFHVVGYGCTTCIGNSGGLPRTIAGQVRERDLKVASVLSGNRNFEARIDPDVKLNFLASPPLVVAFALAGSVQGNLIEEPVGFDPNGDPVYLQELWPSVEEIREVRRAVLRSELFTETYAKVYRGDRRWEDLRAPEGAQYRWDEESNYIREAPFFRGLPDAPSEPEEIRGARALLVLGDSVTTDHISPAGAFSPESPAGRYLQVRGVPPEEFNSYGSRRGNHEVMMRGTFANVRLENELASRRGGWTIHLPEGEEMTVWEAAQRYREEGVTLIVIAGKEYGSGSSRDWAAKGPALLGVRAVIAESFERIHRSNLVGMGLRSYLEES